MNKMIKVIAGLVFIVIFMQSPSQGGVISYTLEITLGGADTGGGLTGQGCGYLKLSGRFKLTIDYNSGFADLENIDISFSKCNSFDWSSLEGTFDNGSLYLSSPCIMGDNYLSGTFDGDTAFLEGGVSTCAYDGIGYGCTINARVISPPVSRPVDINDFNGTSWVLYGKSKISISHIGSSNLGGVIYATFNNDGTILFEDDEDFLFSGVYYIDPDEGNLVIDISEQDLWELFNYSLEQAVMNSGYADDIDDWSFEVKNADPQTRVKCAGDTISLSMRIFTRSRLEILERSGKTRRTNISFRMTLTGDHPVAGKPWPPEKWSVKTKMKLKARKTRAVIPLTFDIALPDPGAEMNSYKIIDPNEIFFYPDVEGSFCRIKNKIYFFDIEDDGDIEAVIGNLISENNADVFGVSVYDVKPLVTATIKNGKKGDSIRLSGKIRFRADIEYGDGKSSEFTRGTLTMTGKGQAPPHPAMTYSIGSCEWAQGPSDTQPRFTAAVEGQSIRFEDMVYKNCCQTLGLEMEVLDDLIIIYEHTSDQMCLCGNYNCPVDANLGPFQTGTYTLEVYQDKDNFIGSTTVTIN